jgi:hypothetical protein
MRMVFKAEAHLLEATAADNRHLLCLNEDLFQDAPIFKQPIVDISYRGISLCP